MEGMSETRQDKNFWLFRCIYFIGFLDFFAISMIIPQFSVTFKELGYSSLAFGLSASFYGGIQLLSGPVVGNYSDKYGRKLILMICLLFTSISYVFLAFSHNVLLFLTARLIAGIFKHTQTLCKAYLADVLQQHQEAEVLGKFNAFSGMGFIVGPMFGGQISEFKYGFLWLCMAVSLIFLFNLFVVYKFLPQVESKRKESSGKNSYRLNYLINSFDWGRYWDIFLGRFLLSFPVILYRSNFSLLLMETFDLTPKFIGHIISFQAAISTFSGFGVGIIAQLYRSPSKLLFHSSIAEAVALAILTVSDSITVMLLGLFVLSISSSIARVCSTQIMLGRSAGSDHGVVQGLGQSVTSCSRMVAPVLAGLVQDISLYGPGILGSLVAFAGSGTVLWTCYGRRNIHSKAE